MATREMMAKEGLRLSSTERSHRYLCLLRRCEPKGRGKSARMAQTRRMGKATRKGVATKSAEVFALPVSSIRPDTPFCIRVAPDHSEIRIPRSAFHSILGSSHLPDLAERNTASIAAIFLIEPSSGTGNSFPSRMLSENTSPWIVY